MSDPGEDSGGGSGSPPVPVLLFDGDCGLCNAVVRFLMRRDRRSVLRFARLQSPFAQAELRRLGLPTADFDSMVFLPDVRGSACFLRTDGVIAVLEVIGGGWGLLGKGMRPIPRRVRDLGYHFVARTRYALFGRYRPRPLPDPVWAERMWENERRD